MNTLTSEIVEQIQNEYCVLFYRGNCMEQVPFEPTNIQFKDECFLWKVEGVKGNYKSKTYFKLNENQLK